MNRTFRLCSVLLFGLSAIANCFGQEKKDSPPPATPRLPRRAVAQLGAMAFNAGGTIIAAALSPRGDEIAVALRSNQIEAVRVFAVATGGEVRRLPMDQAGVSWLRFSQDGATLLTLSQAGILQTWELAAGTKLCQAAIGPPRSIPPQLATNGKIAVEAGTGFGRRGWHVVVSDLEAGKRIAELEALHNGRLRVAVSADGKVVASWGSMFPGPGQPQISEENRTMQFWDVVEGVELTRLRIDSLGAETSAAFAPDGRTLALWFGGTLSFWDWKAGQELRRYAGRGVTNGVLRYSADGKRLSVAGQDGIVQIWDSQGKRLKTVDPPAPISMNGQPVVVTFTENGRILAHRIEDARLNLWDVDSGQPLSAGGQFFSPRQALAYLPDGRTLLTATPNATAVFWDTDTYRERRRQNLDPRRDDSPLGQARVGTTATLSPDGRFLAITAQLGGIRVFDIAAALELYNFERLSSAHAAPAFSADGKWLALATSLRGTVHIWDLESGQLVKTFSDEAADIRALTFSPDKTLLAQFHDRKDTARGPISEVRISSIRDGKETRRLITDAPVVSNALGTSMAWSPDGRTLAAASSDRGITLWDTKAGLRLQQIAVPSNSSSNSYSAIPLAFSPNGRSLAVGMPVTRVRGEPKAGEEPKVQVWEVASGKLRHQFEGHRGLITSLAYSQRGRSIASNGQDGIVLVWSLGAPGVATRGKGELDENSLESLWKDLSTVDAAKAFEVMQQLRSSPKQAVALVGKHLKPSGDETGADVIAKWVTLLDDDNFEMREKASRELAAIGPAARSALVAAREGKSSPEARRRISELVDKLDADGALQTLIRTARALEVLEELATRDACQLLEALGRGNRSADLTEDAKTCLQRMSRMATAPRP
jgi:WD40 repeat protein